MGAERGQSRALSAPSKITEHDNADAEADDEDGEISEAGVDDIDPS